MLFQIQLVHEFQQEVEVTCAKLAEFDSVSIREIVGPRFARCNFLVPSGKGEALAEALRQVLVP
jgi:hypothetical protein